MARQILEIGGGMTPYFIRYDISWRSGDAYACFDLEESRLEDGKKAIVKWSRSGKNVPEDARFLVGDGSSLDVIDHSVDEVVLSNVLSAPIHNNFDKEGKNVLVRNASGVISRPIRGAKADGDLFYRERMPLIREALRMLKPGGTLHIYTDLIIYGQASYERILDELGRELSLEHSLDRAEAERIDAHNKAKLASGEFCYCFDADALPRSSVHRFRKLY